MGDYNKNFQNFKQEIKELATQPLNINKLKDTLNLKFSSFPDLAALDDLYFKNMQK